MNYFFIIFSHPFYNFLSQYFNIEVDTFDNLEKRKAELFNDSLDYTVGRNNHFCYGELQYAILLSVSRM